MDNDNQQPVKEGDIISMKIEGFGNKGDPFGKVDNFVIFVSNVSEDGFKEGEFIRVRITRVTAKQAFAEFAQE